MSYDKCPICHQWGFTDNHICSTRWDAVRVDYTDTDVPDTAYGRDGETAALAYAEENFDRWEYPSELVVMVREFIADENSPWETYEIEVRPVPEFSATRI